MGAGVSAKVLPSISTENVLKSLTDGEVANAGPLMDAMYVEYDWEVPTVELELLAIVKPKLLPALMLVVAEANPALILRCGCDSAFTTIW